MLIKRVDEFFVVADFPDLDLPIKVSDDQILVLENQQNFGDRVLLLGYSLKLVHSLQILQVVNIYVLEPVHKQVGLLRHSVLAQKKPFVPVDVFLHLGLSKYSYLPTLEQRQPRIAYN